MRERQNKGLLHEARKLRATAPVYVSSIATSAPSTAYAVPLPRVARGRLELWHLSFPRLDGGSGECSEPIGAFVQQPLVLFFSQLFLHPPYVRHDFGRKRIERLLALAVALK